MIRITAAEEVRIRHLIDEDGIHPEWTMRGHLPSIEIRAGREMNERNKIGEAKFFLERMEESISDRVAFRYYLSPFLSAAPPPPDKDFILLCRKTLEKSFHYRGVGG